MDRIAKLKEFLAQNPNDSFVQHALALEHVKTGNEEEARRLFETVLNRDEEYVGSYYHLARLLERIGLKDEAMQWYEKGMAMAKKTGDNHAYNELRMAYEDLTD